MADETKTVNLYNAHDRVTGRDGGPYLDQVEAIEAEKRRALVEGREPDLEHPPATAGIPLVTAGQLVAQSAGVHLPSQENKLVDPVVQAVSDLIDKDDFPVNVHSEAEIRDFSNAPEYDAANPTVVSRDPGDAPEDEAEVSDETSDDDETTETTPEGNGAVVPSGFPTE